MPSPSAYRRAMLARRTSSGTSGSPAYELIAPPNRGCYLMEMQVSLAAATASTYGLGRPAAIGVGPTSPVTLLSMYTTGDASGEIQSKTAIAWTTTAPTIPAQFFKRIGFPATIGASILWTFDEGLYIPAAGTIVLWNLATNGVVDVSAIVRE